MISVLVVAGGGALGAVARYLLASWIQETAGSPFPWGTLAVNLLGALILGFVMVWLQAAVASTELRQLITVGFLGSLTTFSTFSYETVVMLREGAFLRAGTYAIGSLALGIGAVIVGVILAEAMVGRGG